jgi:hypothetical protein
VAVGVIVEVGVGVGVIVEVGVLVTGWNGVLVTGAASTGWLADTFALCVGGSGMLDTGIPPGRIRIEREPELVYRVKVKSRKTPTAAAPATITMPLSILNAAFQKRVDAYLRCCVVIAWLFFPEVLRLWLQD